MHEDGLVYGEVLMREDGLVYYEVLRLRRRLKLTQAQFALRVGMTQSFVSQIEAGRRQPSLTLLRQIAMRCGRDVRIRFLTPKQLGQHTWCKKPHRCTNEREAAGKACR